MGTDLFEPGRAIDVLADITRLPFGTDTVDLLICYHVLEHVPDDRAAICELARVLAPDGLGLIQVPFRPTARTDEDPTLPSEERAERFGQDDHVRWYGKDFEDRLRENGLQLSRTSPAQPLSHDELTVIGASANEPVWFVSSAPEAKAVPTLPDLDSWHKSVTALHTPTLAPRGPVGLDRARSRLRDTLRRIASLGPGK